MKNKLKLIAFPAFLIVASALLILSCNKQSSSGGTSHLELRLTDDPGPYDAVYIDILKVEVNASSDSGSSSGWQEVPLLHPGIYNLLNFRNGIDTVLASADLPAGKISQIRLILGPNNSVVINNVSLPLTTPSAQQSGLKLNLHATLTAGIVYRLWIDFDAARSIVAAGNSGQLILKPVIRTYSESIGGSIKGVVLPPLAQPLVWAVQGADTLISIPDSTGYFFFGGVSAGAWALEYHAANSAFQDTITHVAVSDGIVTVADTVVLHQ